MNQDLRVGNFTSSEIYRLLSFGTRPMTPDELAARPKSGKGSKATAIEDSSLFGATAMEYIEECNFERRLNRALDKDETARPLAWGKLLEQHVFESLGTAYVLSSQDTIVHPEIPYWAGTPDGQKFDEGKTVFDLKCPFTIKSFCQLVQPLYEKLQGMEAMQRIRDTHKDGEKYYWQLVSNAILTGSKYGELIVYCPYASEIPEIKKLAQDIGVSNYSWIYWALDNELPFLHEHGFYKNINIVRFEVPEEDKDKLIHAVLKAREKLIDFYIGEPIPA